MTEGRCPICFEEVLEGVRCSCGSRIHHACVASFAISMAEEGLLPLKCPECACHWDEEVYVNSLGTQLPRFQRAKELHVRLQDRKETTSPPASPRTQEALERCGIRQCPRCHMMIQKQGDGLFTGCDKMTCRCGCMFCFKCGCEAFGGVARCRCVGLHHSYIPRSAVLSNYQGPWILESPLDMDLTRRPKGRSKAAAARLQREAKVLAKDPPPFIRVAHTAGDARWHFLMEGPSDSPFEGGSYWGELDFPKDYPYSPPLVRFRTPNGRFQVDFWLCRTQMDYHPEGWQPAWTLGGFLLALLALLCSDGHTSGMVQPATTYAEKRRLAQASRDANLLHKEFPKELFK